MNSFSNKLLEWYNPAKRNLPWKATHDAYKIWLSEIILQQTRVEQGTPYYLAFIKKYPTVQQLAAANLDDVLKLWEGLGYYSRARNLHAAAQQVVTNFNGKFPTTYEEILQLKGIGKYTAAAIASFAYDLPYAVVDGNVYRVLARIFNIETPIDTNDGKKKFELLAQQLIDPQKPSDYNQAIMDFGAIVCKPQNPLCTGCPFSSECKALELNKVSLLPRKSKKLVKSDRRFHYFVLYNRTSIFIKQRTEKDIWKGLFEFPVEESSNWTESKSLIWKMITPHSTSNTPILSYKQTLSHQNIYAYFHEIKLAKMPKWEESYLKIDKKDIFNYAFPKIIHSYLQDRFNFIS